MSERLRPVGKIVKAVLDNPAVADAAQRIAQPFLVHYLKADTLAGIHSGYAASVNEQVGDDPNLFHAIEKVEAGCLGKETLDPEDIATLYGNLAIAAVIEFGGRAAIQLPWVGERIEEPVRAMARKAYEVADWGGKKQTELDPNDPFWTVKFVAQGMSYEGLVNGGTYDPSSQTYKGFDTDGKPWNIQVPERQMRKLADNYPRKSDDGECMQEYLVRTSGAEKKYPKKRIKN